MEYLACEMFEETCHKLLWGEEKWKLTERMLGVQLRGDRKSMAKDI